LAAFGLCTDEQVEDGSPGVYLQNWPAVVVFTALGTQWDFTFSGQRSGIRYASIPPMLEMMGIERGEWPELFESIRIMESAALAVWGARK